MTVCIAALYEGGQGVILASDRMVTAHFPIGYEFEHTESTKIIQLNGDGAIQALVAGDVLRGNEILGAAKAQLAQQSGAPSAEAAAEFVRQAYQHARLTSVVQRELEPRGLNLEGFYNRHQQLAPQIVQMVDQVLSQSDIGVEILVAGTTGETHTIHTVLNPGQITDNSPIGHGAIGSGSPHALYSLIEDEYRPSLPKDDVLKMVKKAKNRSEVAPGVGKETTIVTISAENQDND